ncbi:MAG: response regulator [Chloroflexi bacterium]|nr:response regulator [Chloroflexota bacterium]
MIDDSASICLLIASALQQRGYDVAIALNGRDGLSKLMTFHPHCLILDVLLPDINGYTVCRHVRQHFQHQMPRIILISTKDAPFDQHYGLRQGADRYLPKPFTEETLLQAVWDSLPAVVRQAVSPPLSDTPPPRPALWKLVPRRIPNIETMRTSSPFAHSSVLEDERVRQLYLAIDGQKTMTELAALTGLETKDIPGVLRVLLEGHCIELYDLAGQLVETRLESAPSLLAEQRAESSSWY